MSRIYFDTPSAGHAIVSGRERGWMGTLTDRIALGALGLSDPYGDDPLVACIRPAVDLSDGSGRYLGTSLRMDNRYQFSMPDGGLHSPWEVMLNTCMTVGSEPVRLLATIHGQCEIHGWFAGPTRAHVARVVEDGLRSRVMREGEGWEALVTFLRESALDPVVMSYSVCDRFPAWTDEDERAERSREERWASAFPELAAMEITPERLNEPRRFGARLNGFDVREAWVAANVVKP